MTTKAIAYIADISMDSPSTFAVTVRYVGFNGAVVQGTVIVRGLDQESSLVTLNAQIMSAVQNEIQGSFPNMTFQVLDAVRLIGSSF